MAAGAADTGAKVAVGADDLDASIGTNVAVGAEEVGVGTVTVLWVLWDRGVVRVGDGVPAGPMQEVTEASATIRHDSRTTSKMADR